MVRVQIQLSPSQHRGLKRRARRLGVSVSEAVRRAVAAELAAEPSDDPRDRRRRALAVVGKYADADGPARAARDHDDLLARAYRS